MLSEIKQASCCLESLPGKMVVTCSVLGVAVLRLQKSTWSIPPCRTGCWQLFLVSQDYNWLIRKKSKIHQIEFKQWLGFFKMANPLEIKAYLFREILLIFPQPSPKTVASKFGGIPLKQLQRTRILIVQPTILLRQHSLTIQSPYNHQMQTHCRKVQHPDPKQRNRPQSLFLLQQQTTRMSMQQQTQDTGSECSSDSQQFDQRYTQALADYPYLRKPTNDTNDYPFIKICKSLALTTPFSPPSPHESTSSNTPHSHHQSKKYLLQRLQSDRQKCSRYCASYPACPPQQGCFLYAEQLENSQKVRRKCKSCSQLSFSVQNYQEKQTAICFKFLKEEFKISSNPSQQQIVDASAQLRRSNFQSMLTGKSLPIDIFESYNMELKLQWMGNARMRESNQKDSEVKGLSKQANQSCLYEEISG